MISDERLREFINGVPAMHWYTEVQDMAGELLAARAELKRLQPAWRDGPPESPGKYLCELDITLVPLSFNPSATATSWSTVRHAPLTVPKGGNK